jgi:hypothetical protein
VHAYPALQDIFLHPKVLPTACSVQWVVTVLPQEQILAHCVLQVSLLTALEALVAKIAILGISQLLAHPLAPSARQALLHQ